MSAHPITTPLLDADTHASSLNHLLSIPQFRREKAEKSESLLDGLTRLTRHHSAESPSYAQLVSALFPNTELPFSSLDQVPWLPVGLFKSHKLQSISDAEVATVLISSGTTGQSPSRIVLDKAASGLQRKALASIMGTLLGPRRLPMLILDAPSTIKGKDALSARGAGVLGMMTFGSAHTFAFDETLNLRTDAVREFLQRFGHAPFLIFGFTFLVWQGLIEQLPSKDFDFSNGTLVHSGGWKKLIERSVSDAVFKEKLRLQTGLKRIHNFYGMVEQIGGVFLEGDDGLLYPPDFSDLLIRDPLTLEVLPHGSPGIIQVMSLLPRSYPGHSILTEDMGVIEHEDAPHSSRRGKGFRVLGRVPKVELRGCSDVLATAF